MKTFLTFIFCFFVFFSFANEAAFSQKEAEQESQKTSPRSSKETITSLIKRDGTFDIPLLERWIEEETGKKKHTSLIGQIFLLLKAHKDILELEGKIEETLSFLENTYDESKKRVRPEFENVHMMLKKNIEKLRKKIERAKKKKIKITTKIKRQFLDYQFVFDEKIFLTALFYHTPLVLESTRKLNRTQSIRDGAFQRMRHALSQTDIAKAIVHALSPSEEELFEAGESSDPEPVHQEPLPLEPESQPEPLTHYSADSLESPAQSPLLHLEENKPPRRMVMPAPEEHLRMQSAHTFQTSTPIIYDDKGPTSQSMPNMLTSPRGPVFVVDNTLTDAEGNPYSLEEVLPSPSDEPPPLPPEMTASEQDLLSLMLS